MNRTDRSLVWLLLAYAAMLAVMPLTMSNETFEWTFSEQGPFEQLSIAGWLGTAVIVLLRIRPLRARLGLRLAVPGIRRARGRLAQAVHR